MLRTDLKQDICGAGSSAHPEGQARSRPRRASRSTPGSAQFRFIPDLTDKATGGVLVVLILLYVGSQLGLEPA